MNICEIIIVASICLSIIGFGMYAIGELSCAHYLSKMHEREIHREIFGSDE